jgi:predicted acylesterase/phospholipase RssA
MTFDGLIFEGGGVLGIAYVGAIKELMTKGLRLSSMRYFGGTSSGAMVAMLFASKHTINDIDDIMYEMKWKSLKDNSFFGIPGNLYNLILHFGFYEGKKLETLLEKILFTKFNKKSITFQEMFIRTNNHLKVVGTNVTQKKTAYFDHIKTPNMSVSKAVRISMSVPYLYKSVKYEGDHYVDGGVLRNLDLNLFQEDKKILAFDLAENVELKKKKTQMNFVNFSKSLLESLFIQANTIPKPDNVEVIKIINTNISYMDFNITKKEMLLVKQAGQNSVLNFNLDLY